MNHKKATAAFRGRAGHIVRDIDHLGVAVSALTGRAQTGLGRIDPLRERFRAPSAAPSMTLAESYGRSMAQTGLGRVTPIGSRAIEPGAARPMSLADSYGRSMAQTGLGRVDPIRGRFDAPSAAQ